MGENLGSFQFKSRIFTLELFSIAVPIAFALGLPFAPSTYAKSIQKPIELATGENYAPFSGKDLPEGGLATEIVSAAFAAEGAKVKFIWTAWKRAESHTKSGKILATFPYMDTAERRDSFKFSNPIYKMNSYFYIRTGSTLVSATREALIGKRLCRPIGYGNEPLVQKLIDDKTISVSSPQTQEACFRQLKQGRVDLVVEAELVAERTIISALGSSESIGRLLEPAGTVTLGLMAAKNNTDGLAALNTFNRGLDKLMVNGRYTEIVKKHVDYIEADRTSGDKK